MKKCVLIAAVLAIFVSGFTFANGQGEQGKAGADSRITLAFVTNGPYTFWTYSNAGIIQAQKEYPVKVEFYKPPNSSVEEQKRFIETMMAKGIKGLGISVIDPVNETPMLNEIAKQIPLVCFDSDAPDSGRSAYVGMSNYAAGRLEGQQIKDALPDGGTIVVTVGHLDAQNAIERIQAIINAACRCSWGWMDQYLSRRWHDLDPAVIFRSKAVVGHRRFGGWDEACCCREGRIHLHIHGRRTDMD